MNEQKPLDPDYELRDEYDLSVMTVVFRGRYAHERQAAPGGPRVKDVIRVVSPHLAHPDQARDFVMEISEDRGDIGLEVPDGGFRC